MRSTYILTYVHFVCGLCIFIFYVKIILWFLKQQCTAMHGCTHIFRQINIQKLLLTFLQFFRETNFPNLFPIENLPACQIFSRIRLVKKLISRNFCLNSVLSISTVWKNEKYTLTEIFFRQINSLVICLVNALLSRNFSQKSVRVNFRNSTPWYQCGKMNKHFFRQINFLLKKLPN